jgi:gluconate 2-dehydrogenase gamma chain
VAYRLLGVWGMQDAFDASRRRLILRLAPAALGGALTLGACNSTSRSSSRASYSPTFFSRVEWEFVNAAVARLIPSDGAGPGAIEAGVPEFIDRQLELPYGHGAYFYLRGPFAESAPPTLGYQLRFTPREIYRLGIAAAQAQAQETFRRDFSALTQSEQDSFLADLEHERIELTTLPASVFFLQLLTNTREGYFADPQYGGNRNMVAWKWIGFPGARADFTDWIEQAGKPYPYGPVSISGASG